MKTWEVKFYYGMEANLVPGVTYKMEAYTEAHVLVLIMERDPDGFRGVMKITIDRLS